MCIRVCVGTRLGSRCVCIRVHMSTSWISRVVYKGMCGDKVGKQMCVYKGTYGYKLDK